MEALVASPAASPDPDNVGDPVDPLDTGTANPDDQQQQQQEQQQSNGTNVLDGAADDPWPEQQQQQKQAGQTKQASLPEEGGQAAAEAKTVVKGEAAAHAVAGQQQQQQHQQQSEGAGLGRGILDGAANDPWPAGGDAGADAHAAAKEEERHAAQEERRAAVHAARDVARQQQQQEQQQQQHRRRQHRRQQQQQMDEAAEADAAAQAEGISEGYWTPPESTTDAAASRAGSADVSFAADRETVSRAAAAFGDRLQGAYSVALYGAKNQVDMASLKLVWYGLMDESERAIVVNAVGICSQNDRNRFLCGDGPRELPVPLFTPQGLPDGRFGDPSGALYLDNPIPDEAVASHTWVEVTHCPLAQHRKAFFGLSPDKMPAWAYVSPGSGVSVNVGNTAVIDEQAAFLAGFSRHGLSDAMAHLTTNETRQESKLLQWLGLSVDEISQLDSVQRIGHQEHWSTQRVHEIIFLGGVLNEATNLIDVALASPEKEVAPVMCGRHPSLFRCRPDSRPLAFMSNCSSTCEAPLPCESISPCVPHGSETDLGRRKLPIVTTLGFGEMSPPEGFQCGIPELRYTVRVDRQRVMQPRPLWVPKRATPPLEGIFWTHFPKTSTEFGRTLLSYACGPTAFDAELDVSTVGGIMQPANCPRLSEEQQSLPHSPAGGPGAGDTAFGKATGPVWFHEWVPWENSATSDILGGVQPIPKSVVSIFRDPAQRAISSFHYFYNKSKSNETCCGGGWGWEKSTRRKLKKKMSQAEPFDALQMFMKNAPPENCMTNMLLGQGCLDSSAEAHKVVASPEGRKRAINFVSKHMAFVGILERYDETVCLFHVRFGEPLWTTEIQFRPDGPQKYDPSPYDSLKAKGLKSFDEVLYRVAMKRFDAEVQSNQEDVDECMAAIRRHRDDLQVALNKRKSAALNGEPIPSFDYMANQKR
eukprot:Transcript_10862.p1 GENE.Transcript_10862~~Transcript_10862.p1  ORF type:complete len:1015 (+),score=254.16 Transcript_10862:259-3045(+)